MNVYVISALVAHTLFLLTMLTTIYSAGRRRGKWEALLEACQHGFLASFDYDKNEYSWKAAVDSSITFPDGTTVRLRC